ncbi:hypothetical protein L915_14953 [Phytophthora nicotianae]|uniref:Uncharacterized protein n=3 Tax=Phytophthora nicotianae TaxID=4792 RepID=W2R0V1_PHYN3|nr:hypothetical protein PPTG_21406 [Phytophthora nicotianae INRA-310]ETI38963.1 hypothetical protein F443_15399 [Phytophthora nicotianae P1569]ETK79164.1 hypothetical protein L915_14953 [Phytophthora nicotianae]ETL32588.1 hypothetical protein L916_14854 [Phytophthora nicotianae]ETN19072.1 hypothetical protein PPTG_21406 [Phytophthora nicotianae INRA-310]
MQVVGCGAAEAPHCANPIITAPVSQYQWYISTYLRNAFSF